LFLYQFRELFLDGDGAEIEVLSVFAGWSFHPAAERISMASRETLNCFPSGE